jgi:Flp pilus assembly protein TadB
MVSCLLTCIYLLLCVCHLLRLRRSPSQTKAASEQRHAKAERLREQLAEARLTRLHEQLAKQQRKAAAANKVRTFWRVGIMASTIVHVLALG